VAWEKELAMRSSLTSSVRVRCLALFCEVAGLTPGEIVRRARGQPEAFHRLLSEYAVAMNERGRTGVYLHKVFGVLKSWLAFNGVDYRRFPKISAREGTTVENERVPSAEELRRILAVSSPRGRVAVLLMAGSGVRPGVLGSMDGTDGLRLGDLPDLELTPALKFRHTTFVIRVRSTRDKVGKGYMTFGGPELGEALLAYLGERAAAGEVLTPESAVIAPLKAGMGGDEPGRCVTTKAIQYDIRTAIRSAGLSARPYVLRARFATSCLLGEQHGTVTRDVREFWMGHGLGAIQNRYTLGKRLTEETIEAMRVEYERTLPYISAMPVASTSNEEAFRVMLRGVGYDDAAIAGLGKLTADKTIAALKRKQESDAEASGPVEPGQQKVVDATAVEAWIEKGWRFVSPLNGTKAVIESPRE
jgi:integrase